MKYYLLVLILSTFCIAVSAQDLIPNPSFEEYTVRKPGLYEYLPFNAKYWHCFRKVPPGYYNAKSTSYEDRVLDKEYNYDLGDSSFVCCRFWDFFGSSGEILSCKMKAPIKTDVEYALSFDYQYIKMRSGIKLGHLDALFSTSVTFANSDGSAPYDIFSKYESEIVQRVKSDTIISDGKWHTSKIRFRATSDATFFTLTFCKYSDGIKAAIKEFRKEYQFRGTFNLTKVEKMLQAEDILIDRDNIKDIKRVTDKDILNYYGAYYFIDNVNLVPIDSIYSKEDLVADEAFAKASEINVEENIKHPVHKFSIEDQKYIFQNKDNDEIIETDSMAFDNARFMQNFRDGDVYVYGTEDDNPIIRPCYDDSLEYILASRLLIKNFGEPYWNGSREYFRICNLEAEKPTVCIITEEEGKMHLNIKISDGSFLFSGNLITDTTILLSPKEATQIRKIWNIGGFDNMQNSPLMIDHEGGLNAFFVDFNMYGKKNTFVVNSAYFHYWQHNHRRKNEYRNVFELIGILMRIAEENGIACNTKFDG